MPKTATIMGRARSIKEIGEGLKRHGYQLAELPKLAPTEQDVIVLWNRLSTHDPFAKRYDSAGGKVIIAEHGWVGKDTYALCLNHHNGAGDWHIGPESRWHNFGIEAKPWRTKGEHILVVPQRGIGIPPVAMPRIWTHDVTQRLAKITSRRVIVRYPGERIHPIEPEFKNCHAIVTWASGGGIKAIVEGYPVFYEMPHWIGAYAARPGLEHLENPYLGERDTLFHKMSWAMWLPHEIETGEPFEWLLRCIRVGPEYAC